MQVESGAKIGPVMGTFLVATTMIGSGIYMLPATVAAIGSISIIGWVIAAIGAMLMGLTLAFLSREEPHGTYLDSIAHVLGPVAGLVSSILFVISMIISLPMVAVATAGYTGFVFPALSTHAATVALTHAFIWIFVAISWRGARLIARVGSFSLIVGLMPLLLVATLGWGKFDTAIFTSSWNISGKSNASAAMAATFILFMAYLGLENASIVREQIENPRRNVPIATIGGILFSTIVYIASTTVVSGLIPAATLAKSSAPFADATAIILGGLAAMLVAVCGATKAAGTLGALQLETVESVLVMKRQSIGGSLSRGGTNIAVGVIASAIGIFTMSPNVASQFGVLAGALVTVAILSFVLGAVALAKMRSGIIRATAIATTLFCFGLLAAQPARDMFVAAILCVGTLAFAALLLWWRRRLAASPA
jgi:arginine:agmatine antiporter